MVKCIKVAKKKLRRKALERGNWYTHTKRKVTVIRSKKENYFIFFNMLGKKVLQKGEESRQKKKKEVMF